MSFRRARQRTYKVGTSTLWAGKRGVRPRYRKFNKRFGLGGRGGYRSSASLGRVRSRTYMALNQRTGGLLGIEKKFLDCTIGGIAITSPAAANGGAIAPSAGCTGCYSAPAQGDGPTNRDGNKIVACELNVIGTVVVPSQTNQTTADTSCYVYMALVQDTQTNGAVLASENVYSNPANSGLTAANPFRNMSFTSRFKLLAIKRMTLRMPAITFDGTNVEQSGFHTPFQLKWKGQIPVTFTTASTTADIANVTDNSIQLIAYCSSTELVPVIAGNARLRFYG